MANSYRNIEIFATGHHHGRDWTDSDLQQAVENWQRLRTIKNADGKPLLDPPLWLGHEEAPELNERTDLPRFGDVDNLRLSKRPDGTTAITADLLNVHADLASWIDAGKIKDISAEFYEDWQDEQGRNHGIVLRRVAALGATPPQVRSLNAFADGQRVFTIKRPFKFADSASTGSPAMDRDGMLEMLKGLASGIGAEFTPEFLDSLSDEQLGMLIKSLAPKTPETPEEVPADTALADAGAATAPAPATPPSAVTVKFADAVRKQLAALVTPLKAQLGTLSKELEAARKQTADTLREEKSRKVHAFMDRMLNDGTGNCRVRPADRERLTAQLMRADAVNKVVKFGDGDKAETLTELDAQMRTIESGPIILKFGDKMPLSPEAANRFLEARQRVKARVEAARSSTGKTLEERLGISRPRGMV